MRYLIIISCLLQCLLTGAQTINLDSILSRTTQQCILFPQEKIYVHTDKATYISGENVWMRAHVVDGIAHVPAQVSRYVYVVLQNPFLETIAQIRLRADEKGHIHGNIPLPEDLPKGEYTLCAYTRYMENSGEEYFFQKRIFITNVLNKSIRMQTEMIGSNLLVKFINPVTGEQQDVKSCTAKLPSGYIDVQRSDKDFRIKIHDKKEKTLLLQTGNYKEFISTATQPDYEVDFLPEGGNLPTGTLCRIAFKALNEQGQGEPVMGTIRNERDSIITEFRTFHRGMGVVSFIPETGQKYHAVCENSSGKTKHFKLPLPEEHAYSLQINQVKDKIYAKVLHCPNETATDSLFIFAHQRGWPKKIGKWGGSMPYLIFDSKDFTSGSASFLLVDTQGRIISERMAFVNLQDGTQGTITPDAPSYEAREKMNLHIQVADAQGHPWNGDCSVAITDNADIHPDSCINILSSLLLSSDLEGYIEAPAWYFETEQPEARKQALDILMMTQGWRKYDLLQVWQGKYKTPAITPELSQSITGKVTKRISRQPVEKADVHLMSLSAGLSEEVQTDSAGRFHFRGFECPDSTDYWVSAYSSRGKDNIVVQTEKEIFPALNRNIPPFRPDNLGNIRNNVPQEYLAKADIKMVVEKGIRHIFLDEVLITAPRKVYKTEYEKVLGAISIKEEDIRQSGAQDIAMLLQLKIAGLNMVGFSIHDKSILVILDGVMLNPDNSSASKEALRQILYTLSPDNIEQIDVIKGAQSIAYHSKFSNVIAITTKQGSEKHNAKYPVTNLEHICPLGYQQPVAFYSPRYDITANKENKNPDLRTTILWQPHVAVKDGQAQIECYTADGTVDYTIAIEGVGNDGTLLHLEKQIRNNK
ncbi:MG2 domain-containing protein [Phocaeicola sp.]